MRAAVNPLHAVPENGLRIAQPRFINGRCGGSLFLQPRDPGDGVTVGGAALAGATKAELPRAMSATTARLG